jgi:hypothetical protein
LALSDCKTGADLGLDTKTTFLSFLHNYAYCPCELTALLAILMPLQLLYFLAAKVFLKTQYIWSENNIHTR